MSKVWSPNYRAVYVKISMRIGILIVQGRVARCYSCDEFYTYLGALHVLEMLNSRVQTQVF